MQLCLGGRNPGRANPLWLSDFWPLCERHVETTPRLEVRVGAFQKKILHRPSVFSTVLTLRLAVDSRINDAIASSAGADIIQKGSAFACLFCDGCGVGDAAGRTARPEWLQAFAGSDGFLLSSAVEVHPCDYLDNGQPCGITDMPNVMASSVVILCYFLCSILCLGI